MQLITICPINIRAKVMFVIAVCYCLLALQGYSAPVDLLLLFLATSINIRKSQSPITCWTSFLSCRLRKWFMPIGWVLFKDSLTLHFWSTKMFMSGPCFGIICGIVCSGIRIAELTQIIRQKIKEMKLCMCNSIRKGRKEDNVPRLIDLRISNMLHQDVDDKLFVLLSRKLPSSIYLHIGD